MSLSLALETRLKPFTKAPSWRWFSFFTCLLAGFALFLLSLIFLPLPNLWHGVLPADASFLAGTPLPLNIDYSPQLLGYAFIFCTLGVRWATLVYALLLVIALLFPVFAEGGSWQFWLSPSFAYVVGSFFAFMVMAQKWQFLLKYTYSKPSTSKLETRSSAFGKRSPLRLWLKGTLLALWTLFTLHFIGTLGLAFLVLFQQMSFFEATQWCLTHTLFPLPYDYVGILLLLWGTRSWRMLFRFFLYSPEKPKTPALELS
ncbi:MAG: biotin transporter BioY [Vampirovibrionales bacterium]|jgi:hypothetical protein